MFQIWYEFEPLHADVFVQSVINVCMLNYKWI